MEYIRLKKDSIFRVGIMDADGNVKLDEDGNEVVIEFDLENIETPTNYSKCYHLIKKADAKLQQQMVIIKKQQDSKGKGLMSKNEEATINALKTYYKEVEEAMDLFLGEGGTKKIFGSRRYIRMFNDLSDMLKPILPKLKLNSESIIDQIKLKYVDQEDETIS